MSDQFRLSEDIVQEEAAEVLAGDAPVDVEQPGFASLLTVLRGAKDGSVTDEVQVAYFNALMEHLEDARAQLEGTEIPPEIAEAVSPTLEAMRGLLRDLEWVLNHFGDYLSSGDAECLDQAIALLESIHEEVRKVLQ